MVFTVKAFMSHKTFTGRGWEKVVFCRKFLWVYHGIWEPQNVWALFSFFKFRIHPPNIHKIRLNIPTSTVVYCRLLCGWRNPPWTTDRDTRCDLTKVFNFESTSMFEKICYLRYCLYPHYLLVLTRVHFLQWRNVWRMVTAPHICFYQFPVWLWIWLTIFI